MKSFSYDWGDIIFLLHIQVNKEDNEEKKFTVKRVYVNGNVKEEVMHIGAEFESNRFIISRTHSKEVRVEIEYPEAIVLEAFEIDDRAYYPTKSFFKK